MDISWMKDLKFGPDGLIPAVIQEHRTGQVLMVAYMNEESLRETFDTGLTHFWSRSRNRLWQKGETSGHIQRVMKIAYDCDEDCLLVQVEQVGVACHTGNPSCFYRETVFTSPNEKRSRERDELPLPDSRILEKVYQVILQRKEEGGADSYVHQLMTAGQDRILKKVGEEAGELIIGSKNRRPEEILHEMADLWFHSLVLLGYHDISIEELYRELEGRFGVSGLERKKKGGRIGE